VVQDEIALDLDDGGWFLAKASLEGRESAGSEAIVGAGGGARVEGRGKL
jgi:hypothetical protein